MDNITEKITSLSEQSEVMETAAANLGVNTVIRGKGLREFSEFLLKHDDEKNFGGLCRVFNNETGNAMWVTDDSADQMKTQNNHNNAISLETELAAAKNESTVTKNELVAAKNELTAVKNELAAMKSQHQVSQRGCWRR